MYCIYCYQNFSNSKNFQEHTTKEHSCFLKNSSPDSIRLTRQNSCASDTTTVLSDTEAPSEESSLKRDDTIILEVLDDNVTKSDQLLISGSSSMERIPTIDLQALCQNIIGSQRSSMGKLASDDTIDRILPGFSMSLINLLQDDQVLVLNDPKQGASFQIRRTPSMSTPTVDINIVQENPWLAKMSCWIIF
uniref:C2H2-type domain-containing protein n=1 Tax=Magallana gigas TaxID=29159 RepID=A0A8W8J314_MAGGI